jgi:hypothetical protein
MDSKLTDLLKKSEEEINKTVIDGNIFGIGAIEVKKDIDNNVSFNNLDLNAEDAFEFDYTGFITPYELVPGTENQLWGSADAPRASAPYPTEMGCAHNWVTYVGFIDSYEHCVYCGVKRNT